MLYIFLFVSLIFLFLFSPCTQVIWWTWSVKKEEEWLPPSRQRPQSVTWSDGCWRSSERNMHGEDQSLGCCCCSKGFYSFWSSFPRLAPEVSNGGGFNVCKLFLLCSILQISRQQRGSWPAGVSPQTADLWRTQRGKLQAALYCTQGERHRGHQRVANRTGCVWLYYIVHVCGFRLLQSCTKL